MTYFRDGEDKMNRTAKRKKPSARVFERKGTKDTISNVQSLHSSQKTGEGICLTKLAQPVSPRARDANPARVS